MECVLPDNSVKFWAIITPFTTLGIVILVTLALYLIYRKRILEEWDTMRINGLKRRFSPAVPTLLLFILMHFHSHRAQWNRSLMSCRPVFLWLTTIDLSLAAFKDGVARSNECVPAYLTLHQCSQNCIVAAPHHNDSLPNSSPGHSLKESIRRRRRRRRIIDIAANNVRLVMANIECDYAGMPLKICRGQPPPPPPHPPLLPFPSNLHLE